jgi:hypothetical protein
VPSDDEENMNKFVKYLIIFIAADILLLGIYFGFIAGRQGKSKSPLADYEWVEIDEYYIPRDFVESYIKNDAIQKESLPVSIRNYGKNPTVLRRFRGKNFANPKESELRMMYNGLEDWKMVDLKYKEREREVLRTILYVMIRGEWSVGDIGTLTQ